MPFGFKKFGEGALKGHVERLKGTSAAAMEKARSALKSAAKQAPGQAEALKAKLQTAWVEAGGTEKLETAKTKVQETLQHSFETLALMAQERMGSLRFETTPVHDEPPRVKLDVPVALARHSGARLVDYRGPLYATGEPTPESVRQGRIGNCYFASAMASLAQVRPDAIKRMIVDHGDGTFTVTFRQKKPNGAFRNVPVTVDSRLWTLPGDGPVYGHSRDGMNPRRMELWFPIIEKAFAQLHGGYDKIDGERSPSEVFEAVLGREGDFKVIFEGNKNVIWKRLTEGLADHRPMSALTRPVARAALYTNTGVVANHGYSVLGTEERARTDGAEAERSVILRNPWGRGGPPGAKGGVFTLDLVTFCKLFGFLTTVK